MKWPWQKPASVQHGGAHLSEERQYTDAIINQLLAAAGGAGRAQTQATLALEIAAGAVSRAFASASIDGSGFPATLLRSEPVARRRGWRGPCADSGDACA